MKMCATLDGLGPAVNIYVFVQKLYGYEADCELADNKIIIKLDIHIQHILALLFFVEITQELIYCLYNLQKMAT